MKKKLLKGLGFAVLAILVTVVGFYIFVEATWEQDYSDIDYPDVTASTDPAIIAQGRYLVHGPAHCSACHSVDEMDRRQDVGNEPPPAISGGLAFDLPFGVFNAANLTSHEATGLGRRTDREIARTIRHGVLSDGSLSVFMSFAVGPMSDEDLTAIVSYLRSTEPVDNPVPPSAPNFVGHAFVVLMGLGPNQQTGLPHVAAADEPSVARGDYLANGPALCYGCHSPLDLADGMSLAGDAFSGGTEPEPDMTEEGMEIIAPNLTPHELGHMNGWDEDLFVQRLTAGERHVEGSKMPWENFSRLTESDARSIWRYLQTVEPSSRRVGPTHREAGSWSPP